MGLLLLFTANSCKKNDEVSLPSLSTYYITRITPTTAESGGKISFNGNAEILEKGVCWSTSQNPTIEDYKTIDGNGSDNFTSTITGLIINTKYYVRAYATNSAGTAYGDTKVFTTTSLPTVYTDKAYYYNQGTASCKGYVDSDGGHSVTDRGICWCVGQLPTVNDFKISCGQDTGSFECYLTSLVNGTTYSVRAYATNSEGTAYGETVNYVAHYIGEYFGGGVIFYLSKYYGLVAATHDLVACEWGCSGTNIYGAYGMAVGTGFQNTLDILNGCDSIYTAAYNCANMVSYYTDWFLPSIDELSLMYTHKNVIGGFIQNIYWSSSETNEYEAKVKYFISGGETNENKSNYNYIRPIRGFNQ